MSSIHASTHQPQGILWETSLLDPEEGIRFRGYSIPELQVGVRAAVCLCQLVSGLLASPVTSSSFALQQNARQGLELPTAPALASSCRASWRRLARARRAAACVTGPMGAGPRPRRSTDADG
jgi:hypothetical protein